MTQKVHRFIEANRQSPVVYGSVLDHEKGGAYYRLQDGSTFKLTRDECRQVKPRWAFA